ncbi:MAG: diadenosine tetraphosphatase ApaH/serine/threonine PP2A family protein phosphatase [Planctomycetota bacterium]|jgi:diadenosine tetraphosphatase ApaH/serine/threonine PP2A family protein phosphatase
MRYAILGDIHANLLALEAVLDMAKQRGVDQILSVGDVVGYGAGPREVLDVLRDENIPAVMGNHDAAIAGLLDTTFFNPMAKEAVQWTQGQLTDGDLDWLHELPMLLHCEGCDVAHGSYAEPELYKYIQSTEDADPSLDLQPQKACFVGHTHVPVTILRMADNPERSFYTMDTQIDLTNADKALINVGSVGQPRDEDPRAALGIYDSQTNAYELLRVEYNTKLEAQRILSAGLPKMLADRISLGI